MSDHASQNVVIFLGGDFDPADFGAPPDALVICADSGACHALRVGLLPDLVCGDCDSLPEETRLFLREKNVKFRLFPTQKDFSDGEAAFDAARELNASEVRVFGAFGGRIDHQMANIFLAAAYNRYFSTLILVGKNCLVRVLEGKTECLVEDMPVSTTVSLIPLGELRGLSLEGLRYPLEERTVPFGSSLTISNESVCPAFRISLELGLALLITYPPFDDASDI